MKKNHITTCVCTYKRVKLLEDLLLRLKEQITRDLFEYSIVVVDNDKLESARNVVETHEKSSKISIRYFVEQQQNISIARNKAIENANGEFIAMIDDDELPNNDWLLKLYEGLNFYNCDGILGPVFPSYEIVPPNWVQNGGFFERPNPRSGEILTWHNTRTGNALIRAKVFRERGYSFDPKFGSGGEDRDFFQRKIAEGYIFVWYREAPVFERIAPERWKKKVLIKRAFLRGKMALRYRGSKVKSVFLSFFIIPVYLASLLILLLTSYHLFLKYLVKICDHLGKIFAFFGIDLVREKYVSG